MKALILSISFLLFVFCVYSQEDEFKPFEEDSIFQEDEFKEFSEFSDTTQLCTHSCAGCPYAQETNTLDFSWGSIETISLIALSLTVIAGLLVRFRSTRFLRYFMLFIGLAFFGFYNGACPCMISSFENTILFIRGIDVSWTTMWWFVGLIPLTYLFGRVWCGWVCHLGAIQEFLYRPKIARWFQSEKTAKILKVIRYVLLVALILQLFIMGSIFWCKIDPFLALFNIRLNPSYEIISGVLLFFLILFSVFTYRPFCRAVCPVGITLGWISHLPGASLVGIKDPICTSCKTCSESCEINAIIRRKRISYLDNKECIACGDCINDCSQCGLSFVRNNQKNKPVAILKRVYKKKYIS